jgi:hypothetical protein
MFFAGTRTNTRAQIILLNENGLHANNSNLTPSIWMVLAWLCSHVDVALESLKDGLKRVVLDTRDLKVSAVSAAGASLQVRVCMGSASMCHHLLQ